MILHPGARAVLARLGMDELGVARAIAAGDLASPQRYENVWLYAMRITGTGYSYRPALDEFVYRHPDNYLTPDFLARCNGLPVIMLHPKELILNSKQFGERIVGTMMLPYIRSDEVWGVAKIFDAEAVKMLAEGPMSTSPAVLFRDPSVNVKMELEDGSTVLMEGAPSLLDHLAICERGVWDKGGEPTGVEQSLELAIGDSAMPDTEKEKEEKAKADAARADADKRADEKLDKVLSHLDSAMTAMKDMGSRVDACMSRMDAFEEKEKAKADAAKKDGEGEDGDEDEKAKRLAADKAKKDAEDEAEKAKKDAESAKADSAASKALVADLAKKVGDLEAKLPAKISDEEHGALLSHQAKVDSVYAKFGLRAPRPLDGENLLGYRRRMAGELLKHSPTFKDAKLADVRDDATFNAIETVVFADSIRAADNPVDLGENELRAIPEHNPITNLTTVKFVGQHSFIRGLKPQTRRAHLNLRRNGAA